MTTPTLFKEYIWLVNTIYQAGRISLSDINKKWMRTEMSEGVEMAPTTNATSPSASTSTSASALPKPIWPKAINLLAVFCHNCLCGMSEKQKFTNLLFYPYLNMR